MKVWCKKIPNFPSHVSGLHFFKTTHYGQFFYMLGDTRNYTMDTDNVQWTFWGCGSAYGRYDLVFRIRYVHYWEIYFSSNEFK